MAIVNSLKDYVDRMRENQHHIYCTVGENIEAMSATPFLKKMRARELEVIYLTDPTLAPQLTEHEKKGPARPHASATADRA